MSVNRSPQATLEALRLEDQDRPAPLTCKSERIGKRRKVTRRYPMQYKYYTGKRYYRPTPLTCKSEPKGNG